MSNLEDLCDHLEESGAIRSQKVIEAFRKTDRAHFLTEEVGESAYIDRPIRIGNLHQSAVHLYATAIEHLELEEGNSFLNIGSGTGYFSTLVEWCIGPTAVHHGIELKESVLDHAREKYTDFCHKLEGVSEGQDPEERARYGEIQFFHGNALLIDPTLCRTYDRIYVGAGCDSRFKEVFQKLLSIGGIMVGPFDDEILKIRRLGPDNFSSVVGSSVHFAPLLKEPQIPICLPMQGWSPKRHKSFPLNFHCSMKEILLASNREDLLPGTLPKQTWMDIFAYMTPEWFDPKLSEVEELRLQLDQESKARKRAEDQLNEAQKEMRQVKRERDIYMMLARRMQMQLREIAVRDVERGSNEDDVDVHDQESDQEEEDNNDAEENHDGTTQIINNEEGEESNRAEEENEGSGAATNTNTNMHEDEEEYDLGREEERQPNRGTRRRDGRPSIAMMAAQAVASATLLEGAVMENPVLSSGGPLQEPPQFPLPMLINLEDIDPDV